MEDLTASDAFVPRGLGSLPTAKRLPRAIGLAALEVRSPTPRTVLLHPKYSPRAIRTIRRCCGSRPRLTLGAAMLLVENLPQPVGLVASGDASARASRMQREASRHVECRRMAAARSRWPEPVYSIMNSHCYRRWVACLLLFAPGACLFAGRRKCFPGPSGPGARRDQPFSLRHRADQARGMATAADPRPGGYAQPAVVRYAGHGADRRCPLGRMGTSVFCRRATSWPPG